MKYSFYYVLIPIIFLFMIDSSLAQNVSFNLSVNISFFYPNTQAIAILNFLNDFNASVGGEIEYRLSKVINPLNFSETNDSFGTYNLVLPQGNSTFILPIINSSEQALYFVTFKFTSSQLPKDIYLDNPATIYFISKDSSQSSRKIMPSTSSGKDIIKNDKEYIKKLIDDQIAFDNSYVDRQYNKIQNYEYFREIFKNDVLNNVNITSLDLNFRSKGLQRINATFYPVTNNSGSFNLVYENERNRTNIFGVIENSTLISLQLDSNIKLSYYAKTAIKNDSFISHEKSLEDDGFKREDINFDRFEAEQIILFLYLNDHQEMKKLIAEFDNDNLVDIRLEGNTYTIIVLIIITLFSIVGIIVLIYFIIIKNSGTDPINKIKNEYFSEVEQLIKDSKNDFNNKDEKEAFRKLARAIKLILKSKMGKFVEMTDKEIISIFKLHSNNYNQIEEYLKLCSLVAFAKYNPKSKDYETILSYTKQLMKNS